MSGKDLVARAVAGDEAAFATLTSRHRRELHVHCYRMLGSFDEAEDLVQETFLRAWTKRESFRGSLFRAWLYRIATNACLDFLARRARGEVPHALDTESGASSMPSMATMPWLQPYPDRLLDEMTAEARPEQVIVTRETIELAFLAALQLLAPRQRAVLVLRDVAGWSATETAAGLGLSTAAVNSALQRARATLRRYRPPNSQDWAPPSAPDIAERDLVSRFIDACERYDVEAMVGLASEDVRMTVPAASRTWEGSAAFAAETERGFGPDAQGVLRCLATRANRQPAVAVYMRRWDDSLYRPFVLNVLRAEGGALVDLTTFDARLFPDFGLPSVLSSPSGSGDR